MPASGLAKNYLKLGGNFHLRRSCFLSLSLNAFFEHFGYCGSQQRYQMLNLRVSGNKSSIFTPFSLLNMIHVTLDGICGLSSPSLLYRRRAGERYLTKCWTIYLYILSLKQTGPFFVPPLNSFHATFRVFPHI